MDRLGNFVSQPKTTMDLRNGLSRAKWLVIASVKFLQFQKAWFVLVSNGLRKASAIVKIGGYNGLSDWESPSRL
jgi:hypothetical protein